MSVFFDNKDLTKKCGPPRAIQIIDQVDHSIKLNTEKLELILEHENIRNRHVVVISIAGAFRQGKSFLLNFFLKFLYAQVKSNEDNSKISFQTIFYEI